MTLNLCVEHWTNAGVKWDPHSVSERLRKLALYEISEQLIVSGGGGPFLAVQVDFALSIGWLLCDGLLISPPQYPRYAFLEYLITIKDRPDRRAKIRSPALRVVG